VGLGTFSNDNFFTCANKERSVPFRAYKEVERRFVDSLFEGGRSGGEVGPRRAALVPPRQHEKKGRRVVYSEGRGGKWESRRPRVLVAVKGKVGPFVVFQWRKVVWSEPPGYS